MALAPVERGQMPTEEHTPSRYTKRAMREQAAGLPSRAYSIPGFCAVFDLSRAKAYQEIKAGRLKVRKLGRSTRIDAEDAERWWASFASQPAA
jgi:hypothetical protein